MAEKKSSNSIRRVYSKNADWQKLIVLQTNRNKRYRYGEFIVEGVRNINGAINNGWEFVSFIYPPEKQISDWAKNILSSVRCEYHYQLSGELMTELSAKSDTSELMATVKMKYPKSLPMPDSHAPLYMLFDRPSNRGNLGTVIRSCDGTGADGLIICGHGVDPYDPETVASTMGSLFTFPIMRAEDAGGVDEVIETLRKKYPDLQIVGTTSHSETPLYHTDMTRPTILILGNETDGMSHHLYEICTCLATIPMPETSYASSFNAACAATVMLYEAMRQRNI